MKPVRVPISARAIRTTKTTSPTPRTCFGSKPRPRNLTGRTTTSDIEQLLIRRRGLLAHQFPQLLLLGFKLGIGKRALVERHVDIDDLADAAGAARKNDDAVA